VGHVRWFTLWEVSARLQQYYEAAKLVVNDADNFAEESRQTLRLYMNNPVEEKTLKLLIASFNLGIIDASSDLLLTITAKSKNVRYQFKRKSWTNNGYTKSMSILGLQVG
jgi:hypothetical protein